MYDVSSRTPWGPERFGKLEVSCVHSSPAVAMRFGSEFGQMAQGAVSSRRFRRQNHFLVDQLASRLMSLRYSKKKKQTTTKAGRGVWISRSRRMQAITHNHTIFSEFQ